MEQNMDNSKKTKIIPTYEMDFNLLTKQMQTQLGKLTKGKKSLNCTLEKGEFCVK